MLESIGYDAAVAESFAPWRAADASVGRVVRVDRGVVGVLTEAGAERVSLGGALLAEIADDPRRTPCPGDWVVIRSWPDGPHTVERVLPRRTTVPAGRGTEDAPVRAANVDLLVLLPGAPSCPSPDSPGRAVEVVRADPDDAGGLGLLLERLGAGGTVALLGAPAAVAAALDRLVGATPLGGRQPGTELVVVPGGGLVVGLEAVPEAPTQERLRP